MTANELGSAGQAMFLTVPPLPAVGFDEGDLAQLAHLYRGITATAPVGDVYMIVARVFMGHLS
jgi:hypothetical protein